MDLRIISIVFLSILFVCSAQLTNGAISTVFTYKTCTVSPLNNAPLDGGGPGNNFTSPCGNIGFETNVTEVVLNIFPNRVKGADNIVFTIQHTLPAGSTGTYVDGMTCSGVAAGGNCNTLTEPLVLTFSSTALYATYRLLERKYSIPYSYLLFVGNSDVLDRPENADQFGAYTTSCADLGNGVTSDLQASVFAERLANSQNIICPLTKAQVVDQTVAQFFTPPSNSQGVASFVSDQCSLLYCRLANGNDAGKFQTQVIKAINPLCNLFDILERPTGLMNVNLTASIPGQNITVTLSTQTGEQLQAIPGILYAKINNLQLGNGVIGDTIPGIIMTCNTCTDTSDGTSSSDRPVCAPGRVDDMPVSDPFTIYNPWSKLPLNEATQLPSCTLPAATCRDLFGGIPSMAFWTYLPEQNAPQYGVNCNQVGMSETIVLQPTISELICKQSQLCPVVTSAKEECTPTPAQCVPGYSNTGDSVEDIGAPRAFTGCQLSLIQAKALAEQANGKFPGYAFMPSSFIQTAPNIWLHGDQMIAEAAAGDTSEVSIQLSVFVNGELLGEVQTVSPGVFVSAGQSCTGDQGSDGLVAYSVKNTGTLPGNYLVAVTFQLNGAAPVDLTVDATNCDQGSFVIPGGSCSTFEVAAGQTNSSSFNYEYAGPQGSSMIANLALYIFTPGSSSGSTQLLDTETVPCTIVSGVHIITQGGGHVGVSTPTPTPKICQPYQIFSCWDQLGVIQWITRLLILIILLTFAAYFFTFLFCACCSEHQLFKLRKKDKKVNKQRQQLLNEKANAPKPEPSSVEPPVNEAVNSEKAVGGAKAKKRVGARSAGWNGFFCVAIICMVGLAHSQTILSVSSFQACLDSSSTGLTLNCTNSEDIATVIDVSITPTTGNATELFVVKLSTIPPDANSVQTKTSDKCQVPDPSNLCQTTNGLTEITMAMSKPVLQYALRPAVGKNRNPFTIPYCYYYVLDIQPQISGTTTCSLLGTETVSSVPEPPTNTTIFNNFFNINLNNLFIRCNKLAQAPTQGVSATLSTNVLRYYFNCEGTSVTASAIFYEIQPTCTVYQIENPPDILAHVEITATNSFGVQNIFLDSVGQGASAASQTSQIVARIENVQSPSGNFGPDIPGIIVLCDDEGDGFLEMYNPNVVEFNGQNPWKLTPSLDNGRCLLPTPENIAALRNGTSMFGMFYYINITYAQAVGEDCGKLGVDPNIYAFPPQNLFFGQFFATNKGSSSDINNFPFSAIQGIENILTCVPGFGYPYLGFNSTTPCSAMGGFRALESQMNIALGGCTQATTIFGIPTMPPGYTPNSPNMWINGTYLLVDTAPANIALEVVMSFAGSFVGIGAKVALGVINVQNSACVIDTSPGICSPTGLVVNASYCGLYLQICNPSGPGFVGNYDVTTTCDPTSGLAPFTSGFDSVPNVPAGECTNIFVPIAIIDPTLFITGNPVCTSTLFSADGSVDPTSVILFEQEFACSLQVPPTPSTSPLLFNGSNIHFVYAPPPPRLPASQNGKDTMRIILLSITAIVLVASGIALIGLVYYSCRNRR